MKRLIIAVDCDDVLVETTPFLVNAYNQLYGTSATLAQSHDPAYEIWQADEPTQNERWAKLIETEGYENLGPCPEEARVLHKLSQHHELHLITARQEHERESTQHMLDRELSGVFSSMEFVGWYGSKGEICRRINADVLIDDNMRHLEDAVTHGVSEDAVILFGDYPWQPKEGVINGKQILRCKNWREVETAILEIVNK